MESGVRLRTSPRAFRLGPARHTGEWADYFITAQDSKGKEWISKVDLDAILGDIDEELDVLGALNGDDATPQQRAAARSRAQPRASS